MEIHPLTAADAARLAEDLATLDRTLVAELGDEFSTEVWGPGHFTSERPGKWSHSFYATIDGALAGYLIASRPSPETVHFHRGAVLPAYRRQGVGVPLLAAARDAAREAGAERITLSIHADNTRVQRLHQVSGFRFLEGEGLRRYVREHGVEEVPGGFRDGDHVLRVMVLDLRD